MFSQKKKRSTIDDRAVGWRPYLPDCVKLCSLWHEVFPWLVLEDLIVVHCFPVHHGQSISPRLLSVSHSDKWQNTVLLKNQEPGPHRSLQIFRGQLPKAHGHLQKLAVRLHSAVKPPLALLPADFSVIPGHLFMGCGGDQLLQLRSLSDDDLLHGLTLSQATDKKKTQNI